jgi:hypothetical protein
MIIAHPCSYHKSPETTICQKPSEMIVQVLVSPAPFVTVFKAVGVGNELEDRVKFPMPDVVLVELAVPVPSTCKAGVV